MQIGFLCHSFEEFNLLIVGKGWVRKFELALTDSGLYLWKEQEFKIVEKVWPPLKMKNKVGHTNSTILNSCSFQRYRPLFVKASSNFLTHPLCLKINLILKFLSGFLWIWTWSGLSWFFAWKWISKLKSQLKSFLGRVKQTGLTVYKLQN